MVQLLLNETKDIVILASCEDTWSKRRGTTNVWDDFILTLASCKHSNCTDDSFPRKILAPYALRLLSHSDADVMILSPEWLDLIAK